MEIRKTEHGKVEELAPERARAKKKTMEGRNERGRIRARRSPAIRGIQQLKQRMQKKKASRRSTNTKHIECEQLP